MFIVSRNIARFILLVLLQVVIINKIELTYYLNPIIIVYFVLALPVNTPKWLILVSSFFLGLIVDSFLNTPGIVSFSLVFMSVFRPQLLFMLEPRDGYQPEDEPSVNKFGWNWYFKYSIINILAFHLIYFLILGIAQDAFWVIILRTLVSSIFSIILFALFQIFSLKNGRK